MKTFTAPLIFPNTGQELAPWRPEFIGTGCRGVIGPVPRPLWMRFRVPESNIQLSPHILFIRRLDVNWVFKTPTRGDKVRACPQKLSGPQPRDDS